MAAAASVAGMAMRETHHTALVSQEADHVPLAMYEW